MTTMTILTQDQLSALLEQAAERGALRVLKHLPKEKDDLDYLRDRAALAERFNCSLSKIDKVSANPDFPKRTPFGWRTSDIEAWEEKQTRKKR